jgi:hypothetical protein
MGLWIIYPSYIQELSRLRLTSREASVRAQIALDEAFTIKDDPFSPVRTIGYCNYGNKEAE